MLKFFKSATKPAPTPTRPATAARPRPATSSAAAARAGTPPVPPPLPEVSEGNQESDWAMWENSVAFQDSQMPSVFNEFDAVKTHDEKPRKSGEPDPFAAVGKRGS